MRSHRCLRSRLETAARCALLFTATVAGAVVTPGGHALAACPDPSTGSVPLAPISSTDESIVFRGSGNGHSLGMSQYGARVARLLGHRNLDHVVFEIAAEFGFTSVSDVTVAAKGTVRSHPPGSVISKRGILADSQCQNGERGWC